MLQHLNVSAHSSFRISLFLLLIRPLTFWIYLKLLPQQHIPSQYGSCLPLHFWADGLLLPYSVLRQTLPSMLCFLWFPEHLQCYFNFFAHAVSSHWNALSFLTSSFLTFKIQLLLTFLMVFSNQHILSASPNSALSPLLCTCS